MLQGPQKGLADLSFAVPSTCADRVASGDADLGIVPVIEMERHGMAWVPGTGIACRGPVRSIFLISKCPFGQIRTLAADTGSRTSVELARIILTHRFGADPVLLPMDPSLPQMLGAADAALLIGDSALALEPSELDYPALDLGEEWVSWTGLPMVFALWSGPPPIVQQALAQYGLEKLFTDSCRFGLAHLDRIIEEESERRGFPEHLIHQYLTRNIVFQLDTKDYEGMRRFLALASSLKAPQIESVPAAT